MAHAFDLLELDEHNEPVGRGLRAPSNGEHRRKKNSGESNAPLAQTNIWDCWAHADASSGAVASEASPSSSASMTFDLDQAVDGVLKLMSKWIGVVQAMTAERPEAATTKNTNRPQPSRIFVAIKIAAEIADELAQMTRGLERFQVRIVAPVDIHLTLVPPWNEVSIPEAVEKLRRVVDRFDPFALTFQHIGYGPDAKRPRLLWAECAAGHEIAELRAALLLAFGQTDERPLRPHVTLARLRGNGAIIARKHPIEQDLSLVQRIETVELMQSPPPGGSGYRVLASLQLGAAAEKTSSVGPLEIDS